MPDAGARQAPVQLHGVHAGDAEYVVHTVAFQKVHQYFAAGRHTGRSCDGFKALLERLAGGGNNR